MTTHHGSFPSSRGCVLCHQVSGPGLKKRSRPIWVKTELPEWRAGTVGARQAEWFTLDERSLELDGDEPVMRVPRIHNKSRRPKSIPLTPREALLLKEQLLARKAGTSLVFPNDKGAQWNRHRFRDELWQDAVEAAGYDSLPFHMLRHTAISLMCRAGYRPEWVAERVGHSDGGALVLKRYRHLYPSESYAAAPSLDALLAESGS